MKITNTTYINLAKRFATILLLCTIGVSRILAGTDYEIIFKNCDEKDEYSTPRTTCQEILGTKTYNNAYIASIDEATNIYNSRHGRYQGVRIGNQSETGALTMTFATKCQINASKILFRMAQYYGHHSANNQHSDEGEIQITITYTDNSTTKAKFNPENLSSETDTTTNAYTMVLVPTKTIKTIRFQTLVSNEGRAYCKLFKIYSAPILQQPTVNNITKTTATIASKIEDKGSPNQEIYEYGFITAEGLEYLELDYPHVDQYVKGTSHPNSGTMFSQELTNLTPGTTYYVRPYTKSDKTWHLHTYSAEHLQFNTQGHIATFQVGEYGTCQTTSIEEFPNTAGITLPIVEVEPNSGYRFLGWATTSGATTADAGNAGDIYNLESDMIFYAVYIQQFTVQWLIDGKPTTSNSPTTIVDKGSKVTQLPSPPPPADQCGQAFVGWTSTPITATQTSPPTILFTTTENSPQINENTTFYAVFADIEQ